MTVRLCKKDIVAKAGDTIDNVKAKTRDSNGSLPESENATAQTQGRKRIPLTSNTIDDVKAPLQDKGGITPDQQRKKARTEYASPSAPPR